MTSFVFSRSTSALHQAPIETVFDRQNFCYPLEVLESDAVRLEPFVVRDSRPRMRIYTHCIRAQPSIHGKEAWKKFDSAAGELLYRFIPFSAPRSYEEFLTMYETRRQSTAWLNYAIIDKDPSGDKLAGCISWLNANSSQLVAEIGAVLIFPDYQVCSLHY